MKNLSGSQIVIILSAILLLLILFKRKPKATKVLASPEVKLVPTQLELNQLTNTPFASDQFLTVSPSDILETNPNFNAVYLEKQSFPDHNHTPVNFQSQIDKSIKDQSIPNYLQNSLWIGTADLPEVRYKF